MEEVLGDSVPFHKSFLDAVGKRVIKKREQDRLGYLAACYVNILVFL